MTTEVGVVATTPVHITNEASSPRLLKRLRDEEQEQTVVSILSSSTKELSKGERTGRKKRVTWPTDEQLVHIRLFESDLIEANPLPMPKRKQHVVQATVSWNSPPALLLVTPGFSRGYESKQKETELEREKGIFEVHYPRLAMVPKSPSEPPAGECGPPPDAFNIPFENLALEHPLPPTPPKATEMHPPVHHEASSLPLGQSSFPTIPLSVSPVQSPIPHQSCFLSIPVSAAVAQLSSAPLPSPSAAAPPSNSVFDLSAALAHLAQAIAKPAAISTLPPAPVTVASCPDTFRVPKTDPAPVPASVSSPVSAVFNNSSVLKGLLENVSKTPSSSIAGGGALVHASVAVNVSTPLTYPSVPPSTIPNPMPADLSAIGQRCPVQNGSLPSPHFLLPHFPSRFDPLEREVGGIPVNQPQTDFRRTPNDHSSRDEHDYGPRYPGYDGVHDRRPAQFPDYESRYGRDSEREWDSDRHFGRQPPWRDYSRDYRRTSPPAPQFYNGQSRRHHQRSDPSESDRDFKRQRFEGSFSPGPMGVPPPSVREHDSYGQRLPPDRPCDAPPPFAWSR